MSETNLFGRIVSRTAVERAVIASLNIWLDSALGELERIDDWPLNSIKRPMGIVTRSQFAKWPEDQLPVILVICAGLAGTPVEHAGGRYDASWLVGVAPIVSDVDEDSTRDLAGAYGAAVRTAVLQHSMLKSPINPDGFSSSIDWVGEDDTDIPFLASRSLASTRVVFQVSVETAVTKQAGPRTPPETPWVDPGEWPEITHVEIDVEPVPAGGSVQ